MVWFAFVHLYSQINISIDHNFSCGECFTDLLIIATFLFGITHRVILPNVYCRVVANFF